MASGSTNGRTRSPRFARLGAILSPSRQAARESVRSTHSTIQRPTRTAAARLDPVAAARGEERRRIAEVFASEHVKGREPMAALLLAKTSMSGRAIIALLPRVSRSLEVQADARRELADTSQPAVTSDQNHGWAHAYAKLRERI